MAFDDFGDTLVTAAEDETFRLYNCKTGKQVSMMSFTGANDLTYRHTSFAQTCKDLVF